MLQITTTVMRNYRHQNTVSIWKLCRPNNIVFEMALGGIPVEQMAYHQYSATLAIQTQDQEKHPNKFKE